MTRYTLHIICPNCTRRHAITEWPTGPQTPVLFTCLPKWGGCGEHAMVEPPETTGFPQLDTVCVVGSPLSPSEVRRLLHDYGTP